MIVINITAGPGCGKSTLAASLFSKMKIKYENLKVEYVLEYAKDIYFEENPTLIDNQIQIFSEQLWRMRRLKNKIDIVVTDSPLLLSLIYSKEPNPHFKDLILWEYNDFKNLTYFLERDNLTYQEHGRFQNEEQAKIIDDEVLKMMEEYNIEYKSIKRKGAKKAIMSDIDAILETIKN